MSKKYTQQGETISISGLTASLAAGSIYRKGGEKNRAWIGVVIDDIIGTAVQLTTIDGRPIDIGDGGGGLQYGDGLGDMQIEGVFTLRLPASGTIVPDGHPLYMQVANIATPTSSATFAASGVTPGMADLIGTGPISGCLVGFAYGEAYTASTGIYSGLRVVDVKLLGLPLQGLAAIGPVGF